MFFKHTIFFTMLSGLLLIHPHAAASPTMTLEPRTQQQKTLVVYFDADGQLSTQATHNGYARYLIGESAEGLVLIQDFYAINDKPRTNVYALHDRAGLTQWHNETEITGNISHYAADGTPFQSSEWIMGVFIGKRQTFYPDGKVFLEEIRNIDGTQRQTYFDLHGKPIFSIDFPYLGKSSHMVFYDEQGLAIEPATLSDADIYARLHHIKHTEYELNARVAKLAGQSYPDFKPLPRPTSLQ